MALATNTGAVLLGFEAHQRPPVVALPPQVVTLEGLLHSTERKEQAAAAAAAGGAPNGGKGAQVWRGAGCFGRVLLVFGLGPAALSGSHELRPAIAATPRDSLSQCPLTIPKPPSPCCHLLSPCPCHVLLIARTTPACRP